MGIQLLYSHKKQFHYAIGTGTHAEEAFLFLAKQGIKSIEASGLATPSTPTVEIDEKKSLFLLNDLDDALTAQVYVPVTSDAKVFKISVSHHLHHFRETSFNPGESDIFVFAAGDRAFVVLGKRAQSLHVFFSPGLSWNNLKSFDGFSKRAEDMKWVQKVEKEKWGGGEPLLKLTQARLFDRAILFWTGLDAGALREILIKDHGVAPQHLETLSLNRWHETRIVGQFEKLGHSPQTVRGLLFISTALSADEQFKKKLEQAGQQLKKLSSF